MLDRTVAAPYLFSIFTVIIFVSSVPRGLAAPPGGLHMERGRPEGCSVPICLEDLLTQSEAENQLAIFGVPGFDPEVWCKVVVAGED